MPAISRLSFTNYRSYDKLRIDASAKTIVITGNNGAGKTNILEGLSMLSPAGPFRKAKTAQLGKIGATDAIFTIFAEIDDNTIGLSCPYSDTADKAKTLLINGAPAQVQNLPDIAKFVWITPFMDRLFSEEGSERRRFLDNLIGNFYPFYAEQLLSYTKLLPDRARVLKMPAPDQNWLDSIEREIVSLGISIAAMRLEFEEKLNALLKTREDSFPRLKISISGLLEDRLRTEKSAAIEEFFAQILAANRALFTKTYSPPVDGVHRSDFSAYNFDKAISADQTSTGEQKLAVISIILAYSEMQKLYFDTYPIILFDEAPAHLDDDKIAKLFEALQNLPTQVWLTGINPSDFAYFANKDSKFIGIENSVITRHPA